MPSLSGHAPARYATLLNAALILLMLVPFAADLSLPLGMAVWVLYLFPIVLSYLASRPIIPPVLAACSTLLMIAGFLLAGSGIDPTVAQINRTLGAITAWMLGGIGYLFIRNRLAIRREEWLQMSQLGLSRAMAGERTMDALGQGIISYLAERTGAQAAVLFVEDGKAFRRQASHGVPASAEIIASTSAADGLLGVAISENRIIEIGPVPDSYLHYGSSLGSAAPRMMLVAPASADDHAVALIELGFAAPPDERATELLTRASEGIGKAIRAARYRERLQELLEETQAQAEELQAQSDELRSANEELEEQSQELLQSQAELERQQAELEQTNAQLEEQTQQLEMQRDDLARAQTSLQAQASDLEQASRYKSEFLANMSHELRTPLNSLLIMARLLADNRQGNLSAEQVRHAETIETSGNDLLHLINDILDISKIEAGHVDLQTRRTRIAPMVDKLRTLLEPGAAQKGLMLRTHIAQDAPADIETDPHRLEQILKNFLSNAIKFTGQGEVMLSIAAASDDAIAFTVRDTGIGIPAEQQQSIFEPFRQADGSVSRKYGGTGLGLSISRELAKLLGGDIALVSASGEGSAFTLTLPRNFRADLPVAPLPAYRPAARETVPVIATRTDLGPVRARSVEDDREALTGDSRVILFVEDDPAFARILRDLAREMGFQCLLAETADEGVVLARQYIPQAIILDMGLPDHSGLSVLDRLKRDVNTRHIPVHVVSVADHTHAALSYGAVGYMFKPVKREELAHVLEGLEQRFAQRMRRVLLVEDDATQRESLRLLLATRDVEAVEAKSAANCMELLGRETFDCMVLDLNLPDASGFELLEKLSEDEALSFPPVIVYTGRDLSADEELRLRKYSKSIIIKGAKSPERLLDEVTLFLHQVVSELPERQQAMLATALNRDALLEGRHILVAEDDVRNIYALTSLFEPHGATVHIARNGAEALKRLRQDDGAPIDLVLMDVMMPEMDGLTATREIRANPAWRDLPIITLTAKATPQDQAHCIAAGANDYLAKPLDIDKLLSLVRVWMPR
ncbi:response regulator [Sphingobium bisphenolivorans]|uniref:response regulator n=1 Tax=Sphingobium bisphenolivorans TaxID=1335760 RepID=UPI00047FABDB|nr:response regulator [Sphingobium bisphenolivorans]